jgi:heptaprenylglyceryl phosphate synthase
MLRNVVDEGGVHVIVGGGLRTPEDIAVRAALHPAMIVTGNVLEARRDTGFLASFAQAVHQI